MIVSKPFTKEAYCAPEINQDMILVAESLLFEGSFGFPDGSEEDEFIPLN